MRRLLVVAPHPDDEAIAAWALIRHMTARGRHIDVIVVSDGGASHPESRNWPRPRLIAERRRETRRAMRRLGICPDRICFLGLPDGALSDDKKKLRSQLGRAILNKPAPQLIIGPMPDDAHADHRAVAATLAALPRRGERLAGYRVWPEGAGRTLSGLVVPLSPDEIGMKRAAVRRYRTQAGLITDADAGFAMTHRHLNAFARPAERFAWVR
ncbi:PIG-L deacetylase family protein [Sphingomonas sp. ASY06-1R]|uniref:PIG-L deacetylase family protein n=1 Tax=Sphingomonas sp. ASY06-1R TaxID=3445771 RepID=UPI003FA26CCA